MIAAAGVWKFYGDVPALREVSFEMGPGDCVALLGPNGAGKTTLLKLLARLASPSRGTLSLPPKQECGYLGHGLGLYENLSALENLRFWSGLYGTPPEKASEWLDQVGLAAVASAPVREYSRGMRQRVALGRAFLPEPRLLILDEPFTGLDQSSITLLQQLLGDAKDRGAAILLSSHQIPEVMTLATRVLRLDRGRLA
jgi:heme ABC exporter ATP-binding subunit CcmA